MWVPTGPSFHSEPAEHALRVVHHRVECLNLELTHAVYGLVESKLPSQPLGTWNFADATMLITRTTDFHLATFQGAESVASVSIVVLCGACKAAKESKAIDL